MSSIASYHNIFDFLKLVGFVDVLSEGEVHIKWKSIHKFGPVQDYVHLILFHNLHQDVWVHGWVRETDLLHLGVNGLQGFIHDDVINKIESLF